MSAAIWASLVSLAIPFHQAQGIEPTLEALQAQVYLARQLVGLRMEALQERKDSSPLFYSFSR